MAKKITINDLGAMVKHGFDAIDKRFDKIDKRFDVVDQRLENIELKLSNVAYRFELEEVKQRVLMLEKKLAGR